MNKLITNKALTIVNFAIVVYFLLIWLLILFKINNVLIGVFVELLTIPFLIGQVVFLIIGVKHISKEQCSFITKLSVILLAACALVTTGGFF